MDLNEYQDFANRTMVDGKLDYEIDEGSMVVLMRMLELMRCSGGILDQLKKDVLHGHKAGHDRKEFRRELAKVEEASFQLSQANQLMSNMAHTDYMFSPNSTAGAQQLMLSIVWNLTGLMGEAAEVGDLVYEATTGGIHPSYGTKTRDFYPLKMEMKKELGDVMWYLAALATNFGISLDEICRFNIDRLKARYPDGFSSDDSKNRVEDGEGA